jgi:hypothetical protein
VVGFCCLFFVSAHPCLLQELIVFVGKSLENAITLANAQQTYVLNSLPDSDISDRRPPSLRSESSDSEFKTAPAPPAALIDSQHWVPPSSFVAAGDDGVRWMAVMPELGGYAVAFRNHRIILLDHGLREALRLQTRGAPPSAFPAPVPAVGAPQPASAAAVMALLWSGAPFHVLMLIGSDRLMRVYDLARHALQGAAPLVESVHRRIDAMHQYTQRKEALTSAPLSTNGPDGALSSRSDVLAVSASGRPGALQSQSRSRRGIAQDLEDLIDLGHAKDFLCLRDATAVIVGSVSRPVRGDSTGSADEALGGAAESQSEAPLLSKGLDGLSLRHFSSSSTQRRNATASARSGDPAVADARRVISADAAFISDVYPTAYTPIRALSEGVPTTGVSVALNVIGFKADVSIAPAARGMTPVASSRHGVGRGAGSDDNSSTAMSSPCSALAVLVGDNIGCVTVHAVAASPYNLQTEIMGPRVGSPQLQILQQVPLQLPLSTVLALVALPEQALAGGVTSAGRVIPYSSRCTVAAGGLGGPIVLLHVSLIFSATVGVAPSFRVSIARIIASNGPSGHRLGVTALAYSAREGCLIAVGLDSRVLMWDARSSAASFHVGQLGPHGLVATVRLCVCV